MLCAFWKLKQNPNKDAKRYINSRFYEKLKIEFSKAMKEFQSKENNSQYGKKWYTNIDTGETSSFFNKPDEKWIEGRNWFNNVGKAVYSIITHKPYTNNTQKRDKRIKQTKHYKSKNIIKKNSDKITYYDGYRHKETTVSKYVYEKGLALAKFHWNCFHIGN